MRYSPLNYLKRLLAGGRLLRGALGLQVGKLLLGLDVAGLALERRQPRVERRRRELVAKIGLRDRILDVLAHRVERLDLGIEREALKLILNPEARLRGLHSSEHQITFGLELLDFGLHVQYRTLGRRG